MSKETRRLFTIEDAALADPRTSARRDGSDVDDPTEPDFPSALAEPPATLADTTAPDRPAVIHALPAEHTQHDPAEARLPSIIIQDRGANPSSSARVGWHTEPADAGKTETPQDRILQPGELIANRFRVERVLDSGNMARVYLAVQLSMDRYVAIKVIRSRFVASPRQLKRFQKELRALSRLSGNPNIVTVIETGVLENGLPWIAMEYLEGTTLRRDMRKRRLYTPLEMIEIALQITLAVSAAHKAGIAHRDLKPENVFLSGSTVKVVDFGTATSLIDAEKSSASGLIVGTPEYMAPEQLFESKGPKPDARLGDLYSIGIIEYELIAGYNPIVKHDRELSWKEIANRQAALVVRVPVGVPLELWSVIEPVLRKAPDQRPSSADEHARQLCRARDLIRRRWVADGVPAPTRGEAVSTAEARWRRWARSMNLGGIAGVVCTGAVYAFLLASRSPHPERAAEAMNPASAPVRQAQALPERAEVEPASVGSREPQEPSSALPTEAETFRARTRTPPVPSAAATHLRPTPSAKPKPARKAPPLEISERSPYATDKLDWW